jgi:hypothetical protein
MVDEWTGESSQVQSVYRSRLRKINGNGRKIGTFAALVTRRPACA